MGEDLKDKVVGIRFEIPNDRGTFVKEIFSGIDIASFHWNIMEEEIIFSDGYSLDDDCYTGEDMVKILDKEMYLIFATFQLTKENVITSTIKNYDEFVKSDCEFLFVIIDSSYVDLYAKNLEDIMIVKNNANKNKYKNIEFIFNDNNPRNILK